MVIDKAENNKDPNEQKQKLPEDRKDEERLSSLPANVGPGQIGGFSNPVQDIID